MRFPFSSRRPSTTFATSAMALSKSTAAWTESVTNSPIFSAPQAADAIAAACFAIWPRPLIRFSAAPMALLKEEATEPAIFTARLYSFPLLALATFCRLLAYLDDLLCGLDEVSDGHPH